ncbi:hypothetical protein HDU76_011033, partial [Blyttiomyces sp. JEL0837]
MFEVSPAAVPIDSSIHLQQYLRQLAMQKMFFKSVPAGNVRVTCCQFNLPFDISELFIDGGDSEAIQNAFMGFMKNKDTNVHYVHSLRVQAIQAVWSPDLLKHIGNAETLEIFPNDDETLNNFVGIGEAETAITCLSLCRGEGSRFPSLDGLTAFKHLVELKMQFGSLSDWDGSLKSCRMTKLEALT